MKRIYLRKIKLLLTAVAAVMVLAMAAPAGAVLQEVGPVSGPHGFPLYYTDTNNLSLELCLDEGLCFFDPVDPNDPEQVALGVGGEVFWWMAETEALGGGMAASLTLALEGTFGGDESVVNGQQISFGRIRIRVNVPAPGTYTVIHPFGTEVFGNVTVADGINFTADVGAANFLNPVEGFEGALQSDIGPFLTWPNYQNEPDLLINGVQYVGDNANPHVVVGSPIASTDPLSGSSGFQNFFRVVGPNGIVAETNLFVVMGRVWNGEPPLPHVYPPPPTDTNLKAVGPINRLTDFGDNGTATATFVEDGITLGYPLGYPIWYQDFTDLNLTICQGGNPMCISDPIDPNDPAQTALRTGGETFWWSGDAAINADDLPIEGAIPDGLDALLVLGLEGTFGGSEAIVDGQQISFGRTRIRIDVPFSGDYTVIYPYGVKVFNNVVQDDGREINFTADIGIADPADPDSAFVGALFSEIGQYYLTWTTFNPDPDLNDPALVRPQPALNTDGTPVLDENGEPVSYDVHYVGDPAIPHEVTGSQFIDENGDPVNYFRVIGIHPNNQNRNFDVRTNLFAISGQVFDPITFRGGIIAQPGGPVLVANDDTVVATQNVDEIINVLANDTYNGGAVPAGATVAIVTGPTNGTVAVNADNTVTFNSVTLGPDSFTYNFTVDGQVSTTATVDITVNEAGVVIVPVANGDVATTTETTPVNINVLVNDTYDGGPIPAGAEVTLVSPALSGSAVLNANNTFTYTANAGFIGDDSFTYNVTVNGQVSNDATVTVTVEAAAPVVPVANDDVVTATGTTPVNFSVLGNDTYDEGPIPAGATVSIVDGPLNGTAVVELDNSITYTSADGLTGQDDFTYTVTVNGQESNIAIVTVTVEPAPVVVLTIQNFSTTNNVRVARNQSVAISLKVRNRDRNLEGTALANVTGVNAQGTTIYTSNSAVTVPARSTVDIVFPQYTPTAADVGIINWTVTLQDATATATTRVR